MSEEKKGFIIYKDWCLTVLELMDDEKDELTDAELGQLMKCVFCYQALGEDTSSSMPKHVKFLFKSLLDVFNRDSEKWERIKERRKESGRKGGLAKASNSSKCYDLLETKVVEQKPIKPPKEKPPKPVSQFDDFYQAYPRKIGKQTALKAYDRALKSTTHDAIMQGVLKYKQDIKAKDTKPEYIKHPSSWLNAGCWDDDYTQPQKETINSKWASIYEAEKKKESTDVSRTQPSFIPPVAPPVFGTRQALGN